MAELKKVIQLIGEYEYGSTECFGEFDNEDDAMQEAIHINKELEHVYPKPVLYRMSPCMVVVEDFVEV